MNGLFRSTALSTQARACQHPAREDRAVPFPRRRGRVAVVTATLLASVGLATPSLHAALPPVPEQELVDRSELVALVTVQSIQLDHCRTNGPRKSCFFDAVLRIDKVVKGKFGVGKTLSYGWDVTQWVGPGHAPPGPWNNQVTFSPCEKAKVYLTKTPEGAWTATAWNGKISLGGPDVPADELPTNPGQIARCIKGAVQLSSPPKRTAAEKTPSSPAPSSKSSSGEHGCCYGHGSGKPGNWAWSAALLGWLLGVRRRRKTKRHIGSVA